MFALLACLGLVAGFGGSQIGARADRLRAEDAAVGGPSLLTQTNSTRAIALESVTRLAEPFSPSVAIPFGDCQSARESRRSR
jgi:hypothetical protein